MKTYAVLYFWSSYAQIKYQGDADKSKMQGGGLKSISTKQMNFIEKLASRQRITGDELAMSIVNKSLEQLTGAEADFIIKSVKNNIIL